MSDLEANVRAACNKLFEEKACMPIIVRLAWHDAGTYNKEDKTGGANGTIRFSPEADHGANNGLAIARGLLQPIKDAYPDISYADLYQLASVQAIEFAGGPKIPFRMGRVDAPKLETTPDGRLPDATKKMDHLRHIFYRMGFDDKEIVVLSGAHSLGGAKPDRSGFSGEWTSNPKQFDNSYFVEILKPESKHLRLVSDMALLEQPHTKELVEKYAADQDTFFADYAAAHQKLSELGAF